MKKVVLSILVYLVVLSTLSIASAYYPERAGTVGYWHFDEGTGNVAVDSSGLKNNGTIYGATWNTGQVGGALEFDGKDDYINVPDSSSLDINGTQITIEAWIYPKQFTDYQRIVVKETINNHVPHMTYGLYHVGGSNGRIGFIVGNSALNGYATRIETSNQIPLNQWTYIAGVYNGTATSAKIYFNGVEQSSQSVQGNGGNIGTNNVALEIGRNMYGGEYWQGVIDEVRILNRSLTAEEIKEDYQSAATLFISTNKQNYTLGETVKLNLTINYDKNKPPVYASVKFELQKPIGDPYTIIETSPINFKPGFYKNVGLSYPIPDSMWICSGDYAFKVYMTDSYGNLIASDSAKFYINATRSSKSISDFI